MSTKTLSVGRAFVAIQVLLAVLFIALAACGQSTQLANPKLTIISVPADKPGMNLASEPITGTASGADPKDSKVIVYAYGGDKWYVQPTADSPDITVDENGKWETETHGGLEFAALLVKTTFKPRFTLGIVPQVGGDVLAVAIKKPEKLATKQ